MDNGCYIYVPSLNHTFIVTLLCVDWVGIILQAGIYIFVMWIYVTVNGRTMSHRTFLFLGIIGFVTFFITNVLRMFTEIFLLVKVYLSVYQHYLLHWQAFEEQVGLGLMGVTLSFLFFVSYFFFKRRIHKPSFVENPRLNP